MGIDEATRALEVLLGPYTGEEHGRRGLVVRDARVNRVYDASVRLAERPDPDEGKKKRARAADVDARGPIAVAPLRAVAPREGGGSSRGRGGDAEPTAKRAAPGPFGQVERAESNSFIPGARANSAEHRAAAETASVGGLFGLAGLPLEASSSRGESSAAYEGDAVGTDAALATSQAPSGTDAAPVTSHVRGGGKTCYI